MQNYRPTFACNIKDLLCDCRTTTNDEYVTTECLQLYGEFLPDYPLSGTLLDKAYTRPKFK